MNNITGKTLDELETDGYFEDALSVEKIAEHLDAVYNYPFCQRYLGIAAIYIDEVTNGIRRPPESRWRIKLKRFLRRLR